jgi:hypothetical protein
VFDSDWILIFLEMKQDRVAGQNSDY